LESTNIPVENSFDGIAIIGISARFPKADNINQFWNNLVKGIDCVERFSVDSLRAAGITDAVLSDSKFVPCGGRINDAEMFDASFFGYSPREASLMDPQHRIFLECGWKAIEDSGYDVSRLDCSVGVFASCGMNHYLIHNILANPTIAANSNEIQLILGNDKDFLTTRLSYKLNLRGPSFDIQTACSSSLVAVHVACQNLLTYQCDMALAGGVFLQIPWWNGYLLADGDIRSPDGRCRPFDKDANGTVFGEGAGVVVLKRLQEALKDHDHIYAVIRGSAVNNDGAVKAGFTAPAIEGQTAVIVQALQSAGINASEVSYIETHGTGTQIGDPIEIAALSRAFKHFTNKTNFCALGAVKASIGHLDAAAGIAGLIKTALALYHKQIPPTINFKVPNPLLKLEETPFFINDRLKNWDVKQSEKRYAGVNSLGVGGTNVHIVLEQPPQCVSEESCRTVHFLPFSAKSSDSLIAAADNLSSFLNRDHDVSMADTAMTLQMGRQHFPYRSFFISESGDNKRSLFKNESEPVELPKTSKSQKIVFMFSGQGSQYLKMGADLFSMERSFREAFEQCSEIAGKHIHLNLCDLLYNSSDDSDCLNQTETTQPLLFSFEYALVKLWENYGVAPQAMIGHSIGEYVAACIAGVFSLDDALFVVCERGRVMQKQPSGGMLSVKLSPAELSSFLDSGTEISVINAPSVCVVSGTHEHLEKLSKKFADHNIDYRKINTSHAFHSYLMQGAVNSFNSILSRITLSKPVLPFVSNVSGTYFTDSDLSDKSYWGRHLRETVRFQDGLSRLFDDGYRVFLEVGPGNTLVSFVCSSFASWKAVHQDHSESILALSSVRHFRQHQNDSVHFLNSLGRLWQHGIDIDFSPFYKGESRYRVSLPCYPFEKKKCWINPVSKIGVSIGIGVNPQTTDPFSIKAAGKTKAVNKSDRREATDLSEVISSIWKDLLGLNSVEPQKSFFESGGDSIWASQLLSRIRDKVKIEVPLSTLYKAPTLDQFIKEIGKLKPVSITEDSRNIPRRSELESGLQLSNAQLRLWFLGKLQKTPAYNLATEFEIKGPFKKDYALRALDAVVERHDAFRTTIEESENGPWIRIHKRLNFKFDWLDLSNDDCSEQTWTNEIRSRSLKPYNLSSGPLLRIVLIRLKPDHHIMSVMTHHIISDGWSMGVFLRDFSHYYSCFLNSTQPSLPKLPFRFADYTNWQHKNQEDLDDDTISFWKNHLVAPLPVLELPSFKPRPSVPTFEGSAVSFSINQSTSSRLSSLARNENTTLFTLLLSIYYLLLYKYSSQQDIVIGSPVANRNSSELENLIGFFLNMVPFRINYCGETSFRQLLDGLKEVTREVFAHQGIPFDRLVEIINPQRDLNHHPIFQVMFAYQNFPLESARIEDIKIKPFLIDRGASEYDLSLYMWIEEGILKGFFEYSTDLFERQFIENMASHFINVAESILENQDIKINEILVLSPQQIQQIVYSWNKTDASYPQNECIHDLVRKACLKFPSAPAVISEKRTYTYAELDKASEKIAHFLIKTGIKVGEAVGLFMNRSFNTIAALLGILKSGAAYVPLDPHLPEERLGYMIDDANLSVVLTEQNLMEKIPSSSAKVTAVSIDKDINFSHSESNQFKSPYFSPDSIAYIIYTSGSTGKPKGVRILHRSVVNFLKSMQQQPGIQSSDIMLASTTISFDISVLEIFLPLISGAVTAIIEQDLTGDPLRLISIIDEIQPTIIQGTPAMWRMLISAGWKGSDKIKVLCGGEALTVDLCRDLLPKVKELWNMYGPTETTVWSTLCKITESDAPITIGKPISNVKAYILDNNLKPVPPGVKGVLYIGGIGLAEGYHRLEELTSKKFLKNPFEPGRIYDTGDNARFRFDGNIEYLGRSDFQIKLRGYRIELGEIENTVLCNPSINQCVAACKEFGPGDIRLVLYYTVKPDSTITTAELRLFLKSFLPDYMIPQHFFELQSMPLSPSGKIDRKVLPVQSSSIVIESIDHLEPSTDEEQYLARIWKQVLGINRITLNDNFFELGGHSLLSIRVINQIKNEIGFEIHPRSLMLNTLEQIASTITLGKSNQPEISPDKGFSIVKSLSRFFKTRA
jgi:amino acid adenylation domain-containing protein